MRQKITKLMAIILTCTILLGVGGGTRADQVDDDWIWPDPPKEEQETAPSADDETEGADMAKIESYFNCDLKKAVQVQVLSGNVFSMDNNGNRICVRIFNDGEKATVTGSVSGRCILADGSTVNVSGGLTTANGQSVAYVDIPQGCLLIPGTLKITVQLTDSGVITTLAAILTTVYQTKTDNVITPSQQIINDWNAAISSALGAQDAQISALSTALTAETNARQAADTAEATARQNADNDLKSALKADADNSANGKKLIMFDATFVHGSYEANGHLNEGVVWRVSNVETIQFAEDTELEIDDGYRYFITFFSSGSVTSQSNWIYSTSGGVKVRYKISANQEFKVTIGKNPEVQTTVNVVDTAKSLKYDSFVQREINNANRDMDALRIAIDTAADGKKILLGDATFVHGSYESNGTLNKGLVGRVSSAEAIVLSEDIELSVETGYRFFVLLLSGSTVTSVTNWIYPTSGGVKVKYKIQANQKFKITIGLNPDTQSSVDVEDTAKAVYYDGINHSVEKLSYIAETGMESFLFDYTFKHGSYEANGTLNEGVTWRVSNVEEIKYSRKVTLEIDEGYRYFITFFNEGVATSQSNWIYPTTEPYTIDENQAFKVTVGKNPEAQESQNIKELASAIKAYSAVLDIIQEGKTSVDGLNKEQMPFVRSVKTTIPVLAQTYFGATHNPLTFVHFSDNHAKPDLWRRTVNFADKYRNCIDFAIHTGDYVENDQRSDPHLYNISSIVPVLNAVGNHDAYATESPLVWGSKETAKAICFPDTTGWGVTFQDNITYPMNYYRDFSSSNIRLIVLDNYFDISAQITWLNSLLADALTNNMYVITAAHQATGKPLSKYDTGFQTIIPYDTIPAFGGCVDTDFDEPISDFINNGGKHIVHLGGHEHVDYFFKSKKGVRNLLVECSTDWVGFTEGKRVAGTKTYDCFNVVGIDTDTGIMKVVRIGNNVDSANRAKNTLCFDFVNDIVVQSV